MYSVIINLENRVETLKFYSKWASIYKAKEIGECVDVRAVNVVDCETGEVYLTMENQRVTWYEGLSF